MAKGDLKAVPSPSIWDALPAERPSDVHASPGEPDLVEEQIHERIAEANRMLLERTEKHFKLPVSVLTEQRDRALAELERVRLEAERKQAKFLEEQDAFIAFLMVEHEKALADVKKQLRTTYDRLKRLGALSEAAPAAFAKPPSTPPGSGEELKQRLDDAETRLILQAEELRKTYREVDEARAEATRFAEERDDALRSLDALRAEIHEHLELVRADAAEAQRELDEAYRALDETREEAYAEMQRMNEELDAARHELDERRDEVRRLRARLASAGDAGRNSRLPPPPSNEELETAREENSGLRKQLIDAKRQISRVSRELEVVRRPHPLTIGKVSKDPSKHSTPFRKGTWPGGHEVQDDPKTGAPATRMPRHDTPLGGIGVVRRRLLGEDE